MHGDSAVIEMFWFPEQFLIFSAPSVWNRRKSETRFPVKTFLAWKDRFTGRAVPLHYRTRKNIKNLDFYPKTTAFSLRKQPGVLSCFYFVGTFNSHRGNNNGENCRTKSPPLYYIFMFFSLLCTEQIQGLDLFWGGGVIRAHTHHHKADLWNAVLETADFLQINTSACFCPAFNFYLRFSGKLLQLSPSMFVFRFCNKGNAPWHLGISFNDCERNLHADANSLKNDSHLCLGTLMLPVCINKQKSLLEISCPVTTYKQKGGRKQRMIEEQTSCSATVRLGMRQNVQDEMFQPFRNSCLRSKSVRCVCRKTAGCCSSWCALPARCWSAWSSVWWRGDQTPRHPALWAYNTHMITTVGWGPCKNMWRTIFYTRIHTVY